jgi:hypothetical protein
MTRDEALKRAWIAWHEGIDPGLIPSEPTTAFRVGFCAGWDARKMTLTPEQYEENLVQHGVLG